MFGHTHKPYMEEDNELLVLNPGSLSLPRQEGHRPTYIVMEIADDGQISSELCYL